MARLKPRPFKAIRLTHYQKTGLNAWARESEYALCAGAMGGLRSRRTRGAL
jgi:hypothetical protein